MRGLRHRERMRNPGMRIVRRWKITLYGIVSSVSEELENDRAALDPGVI